MEIKILKNDSPKTGLAKFPCSDLLSVGSVMPPTNKDLIQRAIKNARPPVGTIRKARWACVKDIFAVGSTVATLLCIAVGLDPDELLKGSACDGCPIGDVFDDIE